jgi:type II secretory ATPase GspE/PulE/Tfp pilus assembly ATPase PilB-like protein
MASSLDDRDLSQPSEAVQRLILAQFKADWVDRLNVDQMFVLIDGVLPFEACLYYQVLPLFLEGNRLHLGMVSPEDSSAVDYVRRIVSYVNYSLQPRQISSEALRVVLTAYLNYAGKKSATRVKIERGVSANDRKTLIVDSPEYLTSPYPAIATSASPQKPLADPTAALPLNLPLLESLPVLAVKAHPPENTPENTLESLVDLPADALLQELLARVLARGIGRLYFECHADYGRILWSQDGVLQSVLDRLSLPLFQGIVNALKQLMQLAPDPVDVLKQVEAEYSYDRQRILLRCRFMPNGYGEEATLQVLRGAALKFYQQQQVSKLERDALGIAKQLQTKLKEIRDRAYAEPGLTSAKFDVLPALSQFLQSMEEKPNSSGMILKKEKGK